MNLRYKSKFFSIRVVIPLILQTIMWPIMRLIFGIFGRYEIRGSENLKEIKDTGVIFACNHSSEWDPVLLTGAFPWFSKFYPIFYVSLSKEHYVNSGHMKHIYGGLFFKAWGAYPTYRGLKNYEKALEHHINILNSKRNLCYFPEGKKTRTGELGEAKGGVAFLAKHTNTPVIPVGISGVYNLSFLDFFLFKRKIVVQFGKPIFSKDIDVDYKMGAANILKSTENLMN